MLIFSKGFCSFGADGRDATLESAVLSIFKKVGVGERSLGVSIVDLQSGSHLVSLNEQGVLSPASASKLLTAYVALKRLGMDFSFETSVYVSQPWDRAGVLHGDLQIKGSGDPSLSTKDLIAMAYSLKSQGLKRIEGRIVLDDSAFDSAEVDSTRISSDSTRPFNAAVSALNLNQNIFRLGLSADSETATRFFVEPKNDYIHIKNLVKQASEGQGSGVSQKRVAQNKDQESYELNGKISKNQKTPVFLEINVANPPRYLGAVFVEILKDMGISMKRKDPLVLSSVRGGDRVAITRSEPLFSLVAEMNKSSSNVYADSLVKMLGHQVFNESGRFERGLQIINEEAIRLGINNAGFKFVSGSGLTRFNRMSPAHFTKLFIEAFKDFDVFPEWLSSLSIAGIDGTLEKKMHGNPAFGRLRGKTGTIDGVSSLVGVLKTRGGRLLSFAAIINAADGRVPSGRAWNDEFGRLLVNYEPVIPELDQPKIEVKADSKSPPKDL